MSEELRNAYQQLIREINTQLEREFKTLSELHEKITHILQKLAE